MDDLPEEILARIFEEGVYKIGALDFSTLSALSANDGTPSYRALPVSGVSSTLPKGGLQLASVATWPAANLHP
jgi:hypothetical protein